MHDGRSLQMKKTKGFADAQQKEAPLGSGPNSLPLIALVGIVGFWTRGP